MRPSFSNPSRAVGPICHARRETGWDGPPSRSLSGQYSRPRRPRPEGRDLRRRSAAGHRAAISAALAGLVTPANHLVGDGGLPIAGFARRAAFPFTPRPRRASQLPTRPTPHQQCQRLPQPPQAVAQPLQRRRHQKPAKLPRLAQSPRSLGSTRRPAKMDLSAIGNGPYQQITL